MAFDTSRAIVTTRLEGVARAIASSDYATMKVFDGDLGRALVTVQDHATRSFIITQQLLKRAVSQSASDTAEELRRSR